MNGRRAKQLRRRVFGDTSMRGTRQYATRKHDGARIIHPKKDAARAFYRALKRHYRPPAR